MYVIAMSTWGFIRIRPDRTGSGKKRWGKIKKSKDTRRALSASFTARVVASTPGPTAERGTTGKRAYTMKKKRNDALIQSVAVHTAILEHVVHINAVRSRIRKRKFKTGFHRMMKIIFTRPDRPEYMSGRMSIYRLAKI